MDATRPRYGALSGHCLGFVFVALQIIGCLCSDTAVMLPSSPCAGAPDLARTRYGSLSSLFQPNITLNDPFIHQTTKSDGLNQHPQVKPAPVSGEPVFEPNLNEKAFPHGESREELKKRGAVIHEEPRHTFSTAAKEVTGHQGEGSAPGRPACALLF